VDLDDDLRVAFYVEVGYTAGKDLKHIR
jgi:hypothetical protein